MKKLTYALGAILGIGISYNANATLSFTLHDEFSGGQQPTGSLKVDFTNAGANAVDLTITSQLFGTEFLDELYLNLNTVYDPSLLNFAKLSETGSFGLDPVILTGTDAFQADGGGRYDINFQFDISPPPDRFNSTDSITYHITGITGLVEGDFDFFSFPAGGNGIHKAAAHIQGVGADAEGSGFIAPNGVPDGGATMMLLGTALACLGASRWRFA
jgi:hypothetical protein